MELWLKPEFIEEFEEYFDVSIPEGKFETLGGYIFHLIRKIPVPGEIIRDDKFEMTIESADERSIKRVRIARLPDDSASDFGL